MPPQQPAREVDRRKPPLESRWTRNRRRLQAPAAPPPPPADYVVTGNGDPSPNGDFYYAGLHGGEPYYEREDSAWAIWFDAGYYLLSPAVGAGGGVLWANHDPVVILGTYDPIAECTGNPIVELP